MYIQNHSFTTKEEIISVIAECEARYDSEVEAACDSAISNPNIRFITLTGPTCSGKTTTAGRFKEYMESRGKRLYVISIDDFFRDNGESVDRVNFDNNKKLDYESVKALDLEYLSKCVDGIEEGRRVYLPRFDFSTGFRCGYYSYDRHENDIVMFEGLQAIYPEFIALLEPTHTERVYISVAEDLKVGDKIFTARDVRLIRRIVRDYNYRASSAEFTFYLWDGVVKNEDKNIFPYISSVPIKINSLLGYEMSIIKRSFLAVTESIDKSSRYYGEAARLRSLFDCIPEIDLEYLPEKSVYNEFIKNKEF